MARPKKLLDQQKTRRTKEVQEELKATEEALKELTPLQKTPPNFLDKVAKAEYKRIYPLLEELPIASLDLALVVMYCQTYSNYVEASKHLVREKVVETERGSKLSPYYTIQRDSITAMNQIAPKLGLSLDSRMKVMTPKKEVKDIDPMSDFL
ncbi:phage terminase small subunit P27 family [Mammaliicoccus sciuri]|uniref:phage terminase small subunit P27 family n=1 Tax=Mammaliicoccus sciuri TaxID=1296 RepID=UPI002DB93642|nr:phage terminase small subunit P27 family [Mammaliicoccus sciuri]MEB5650152.1 phage terminase small subunit P27 family [Mammaliicoccus sciuri]